MRLFDEHPSTDSRITKSLSELIFPARDVNFGRVLQRLSEPESGPPADNLMTNEDSFTRVSAKIARCAPPETVYLGVGPDQNFSLMAHASPSLGIIVDYRRRNQLLHFLHKSLFTLSDDRHAYLSRLTARVTANRAGDLARSFSAVPMDHGKLATTTAEVAESLRGLNVVNNQDLATIATIQARLAGPGVECRFLALKIYPTLAKLMSMPGHMLSREELYRNVRSLQKADRILPIVDNFAARGGLAKLGAWLNEHHLQLGVIYVSDVEFFLIRSGRFSTYVANLDRLPWHPEAIIVRTSTREIKHPERVAGDSSTTIVRALAEFLELAKASRIHEVDDLFGA